MVYRSRLAVCAVPAVAVALAIAACADPVELGESDRGGWDFNSGSYNGNPGSFANAGGLAGAPSWGATGPGTLNNATIYGVQYDGAVAATCATATAGITNVRFLSSSGNVTAAVGPDVELERTGGGRARLAMGESVLFPGHIFDGYLGRADVVFRVRRVDTLTFRDATWYAWPVFELEACNNADTELMRFRHLGYVSWAPMVRMPEFPTEPTEFRSDIVQAITTIPRAEYRGNPNVPNSVATQTGALWFKFAFYASLPIALHDEPELDLVSSLGARIDNAEFLWRGLLALGNATRVSLTADPLHHQFLSFFTKDGTSVSLFAVARGDGAAAAAVRLPPTWGGTEVGPLTLSNEERTAIGALDSVQARTTGLVAGDAMAARDTHLGSGPSRYRVGLYLANSQNSNRYTYYQQWRSNVAAMRVTGLGTGIIPSQVALETAARSATSVIDWAIACQSPWNGVPFERPTYVLPIPGDAPVQPPPTDAGVDGPDAGIDGADAGIDGADAGIDGADAGIDGADAGIDSLDAGPDAGGEAGPDAGPDAEVDAPPPMPDAGPDAEIDAPDAMPDGGPPPCFAPCVDAA